ncbi:AraC family transcriptional regulator [Kistimonas asteriae]|uniref:AraC family transcriptional regulator n=1 Tax=Kistimonas asteriae TaxID=517724 RepID=UPI001BAD2C64|nr:helix-turn-helix transcriptional regulator [Kistimonas asteriae]
MPLYHHDDVQDPDTLACPLMGIAVDVGPHESPCHQHQKAQLLYAVEGSMTITMADTMCILSPNRAAWLPPGIEHSTRTQGFHYRSLYFDTRYFSSLPDSECLLNVTPLFRELILRVCEWELDYPEDGAEMRLAIVLQDELNSAARAELMLPLPQDRRLRVIADHLLQHPEDGRTLTQLATDVGASSRTISRHFRYETGMSFSDWRQQLRLLKALELLSEKLPVSEVSTQLGFASDSAFIAMFRRQTGVSPGRYFL